MITQIYAGILGLIFCVLSIYVILNRKRLHISLGSGDDHLTRSIAVHTNFIQYTVFFIVLLFLCEKSGMFQYFVHIFGVLFTVGRLLHIYGLLVMEKKPMPQYLPRVLGMILTLNSIAILSVAVILLY